MQSEEAPAKRCDPVAESDWDAATIKTHVERVLGSPPFARAPRMQRFLSFLVDEALAGRAAQLKEYTIAVGVFEKPVDFDPGTSAVIRVEAGRLRRLLAHYHLEHGQDDEIILEVPKGSYAPVFRASAAGSSPPDPLARETQSPGANTGSEEHLWPGADERRLVTVISCAFGSERTVSDYAVAGDFLSSFDVFHGLCTSIARQHGGTVDGGASDRLIVYFGWPDALEDAAGRASTAALEILTAISDALGDGASGIRIGIATSEVAIRAAAPGVPETRPAVIGQAPLFATAMLQQVPLNGILVAESTRRLTGAAFDFVPAGALESHEGESGLLWRLLRARPVTTRFRAVHASAQSPIIGRSEEIVLIASRWKLSLQGEGQAVVIVGEAGIGKSKLAEAALRTVVNERAPIRLQCSSHHVNSTLYPVIECLKSIAVTAEAGHSSNHRLTRLLARYGLDEALNRALLDTLLSQSDHDAFTGLSASQQKDLTLRLLSRLLCARARRRTTVVLVEDIHWADPTTLELLQDIVRQSANMPLLIVMTSRDAGPSFAQQTNVTMLQLSRLPRSDCNILIDTMASAAPLSPANRARILEKSEGIPLFLEELTKLFLGASEPQQGEQRIPESLSDLLASQLGRLGSTRGIAQTAAVIGRQFTREMLALASGRGGDDIDAALDRLVAAGIIVRSGVEATQAFSFRHALLRDAAYGSLLDHARRALHHRVGSLLIDSFPEVAVEHPEVVARHMMEAGQFAEAVPFWVDAGRMAAGRYALAEAITDFRLALDALKALPARPENRERELEVLINLGLVLRSAHGYGDEELASIYSRARALSAELGDQAQLANAVYGLWTHAAGRGQWPTALALANEFETLTRPMDDLQLKVEALRLLGASAAFRGEFALARHHFERALAIYDARRHGPGFGFDPGAASAAYLSWILWHLGEVEPARECAAQALAIADAKAHPSTLAMVLSWIMFHAVCDGDDDAVLGYNERLQAVCVERDCRYWQPFGSACAEWAAFEQDGDVRHLDRLIDFTKGFRERYFTSCLLLLAADICLRRQRIEQGLELTAAARAFIEEHDERVWEAECDRLTAELLLHLPEPDAALARQLVQRAAKTARRQDALMLERRATASRTALGAIDGSASSASGDAASHGRALH